MHGDKQRLATSISRSLPVWFAIVLAVALTGRANAQSVEPVTTDPWAEAVISVNDLERTAQFFREIGDYEVKWRGSLGADTIASWGLPPEAGGGAMVIGPADYESGFIRLVRFDNAGRKVPMRPGARAWDTGCYFSVMVRMKGMQDIYDDAIRLGWWTETPITYLEFGESRLDVVIYRGPDGVQVQGYERLAPALPDAIPDFERMTGPFNMMQMVRDRDAAYTFFTDVLGFDTFYLGKPFTSATPTPTPIGLPINLTTSVPYRAGIVYPRPGEFGRMEMIEVMEGLEGNDYADRCNAPNLGILAVRFPVESIGRARSLIESRGWSAGETHRMTLAPYGSIDLLSVHTPDGAIVQFFERL